MSFLICKWNLKGDILMDLVQSMKCFRCLLSLLFFFDICIPIKIIFMQQRPAISVIAPIYNEEKNVFELYRRVREVLLQISSNYEMIFVNDGSRDNSQSLIKQLAEKDKNVRFIDFSRNFGHQIAVSAGVDYARGEEVVIIDSDLQDPPELILEMHKKHGEGFEVVYAKRKTRKGESFFKKITAKTFYRVLSRLTSVDIPLDTGDFRLMDRKVVEELKKMPEPNKFLRGQIAWIGFNQTYVEFERDARIHGETGYPFKKMLRFATDGITAFSDAPLKFATTLGFIVFFISLCVIFYALWSYFFSGTLMTGWTSLIISVTFLGGIQLLSLGIIGEYISRIIHNVRKRQLYIIKETNVEKNNGV